MSSRIGRVRGLFSMARPLAEIAGKKVPHRSSG